MFTGEHSWTACSTAACEEVHEETGVSEPLLTIRLGLPACCLPERESVCPYSNLSVVCAPQTAECFSASRDSREFDSLFYRYAVERF